MKERLYGVLKKYAVILGVGIAYLLWVLLTDLRIPCPFYFLTGLLCPGCGVTRMIAAIARLDLAAAFGFNQFLFVTAPVILLLIGVSEYNYVKRGEHSIGRLKYLAYAELVLAITFGVVRNVL